MRSFLLGLLLFGGLLIGRNLGVWTYLVRHPDALNAGSLQTILYDGALPLAAALLAGLGIWGTGLRLLRMILGAAGREIPFAAGLAFSLGAGLGGNVLLGLGLAGYFGPIPFFTLFALFGTFGALELRRVLGKITLPPRFPPELAKGLLIGIGCYWVWNGIVRGLAPPTDWDVQAYHLALPKLYLAWGRIEPIPWMPMSHWPHVMQLLYSGALMLGKDSVAALLHTTACGLIVLAVFQSARKYLDEASAWTAAAILACQPMMTNQSGLALVGGAFTLFYFTAALAVWQAAEGRSLRWLFIGGLLAGVAASCKLHGLILTAILSAWVWSHWGTWRKAGILLGGAALTAGPWYLKAWILDGNPIWPYLTSIFGGRWGAEVVAAAWTPRFTQGFLPSPGTLRWIFLDEGAVFLLGPAGALCVLALAARKPWPAFLRFMLMPCIPYAFVVMKSISAWRYCLPLMPGLALVLGWWITRFLRGRGWRKAAAGAALLVGLAPILRATQNNELFAVLGLRSQSHPQASPRELYLQRSLPYFDFYGKVNRLLGAKEKLLMFREYRGYYLDVPYLWGDPGLQGFLRYEQLGSLETYRRLRRLGITHVLISNTDNWYVQSHQQHAPQASRVMSRMLNRHGRPVLADGKMALYVLDPHEPLGSQAP